MSQNERSTQPSKEEFIKEVLAMYDVCFMGEAVLLDDGILATLNTGKKFFIQITER